MPWICRRSRSLQDSRPRRPCLTPDGDGHSGLGLPSGITGATTSVSLQRTGSRGSMFRSLLPDVCLGGSQAGVRVLLCARLIRLGGRALDTRLGTTDRLPSSINRWRGRMWPGIRKRYGPILNVRMTSPVESSTRTVVSIDGPIVEFIGSGPSLGVGTPTKLTAHTPRTGEFTYVAAEP